jgi:hypothetical protein
VKQERDNGKENIGWEKERERTERKWNFDYTSWREISLSQMQQRLPKRYLSWSTWPTRNATAGLTVISEEKSPHHRFYRSPSMLLEERSTDHKFCRKARPYFSIGWAHQNNKHKWVQRYLLGNHPIRGSVFGWGIMLQAGRSRIRAPMRWIF